MPSILILNGPNMTMLGTREPHLYGHDTLAQLEKTWTDYGKSKGIQVDCMHSNHEGQLIDHIEDSTHDAIILNAAALSHSSIAIHDALISYTGVIVEVHISNIYKREPFRQHSYISRQAHAVICGAGTYGYILAMDAITHKLAQQDAHT
ncbi:MAG: 3-dehydroquinate dehydratase [Alphaproteobacteria bacterium GM7ARS4]|nr:3-dehydroquinate dehydratase [Alphaproteobacteria bacterium GM7ARS4]